MRKFCKQKEFQLTSQILLKFYNSVQALELPGIGGGGGGPGTIPEPLAPGNGGGGGGGAPVAILLGSEKNKRKIIILFIYRNLVGLTIVCEAVGYILY